MKKLLPFLLLLVALVAVLFYLMRNESNSSMDGNLVDFSISDTASVDRIFISDNQGFKVNLVRSDSGWVANDIYLAKDDGIDVMLETFKMVYIKSPVPKSTQETVLRVMASTGKRVEIFTGGSKPEKIWHVGHPTQDHFGTYMILEIPGKGRSKEPFITSMQGFAGHLNSRFFADVRDWQRSEVFRYPPKDIRTVRIEYPQQPNLGFELRSDGENTFELEALGGMNILSYDTIAAKDLLVNFQKVNFEMHAKGVSQAMADSISQTPPLYTISVTDKDGGKKEVKVFYKLAQDDDRIGDDDMDGIMRDVDRLLALLPTGDWVIVQSFDFDRIGVDIRYFMPHFEAMDMP